jgi:hypothetical protein
VAAIGVLSSEPQEYAVRPILFSGTCKKEMSEQHAHIIKTLLEACNKQKQRNKTTYCPVCIASDGEAKCGDALVIQAMTSELTVDSQYMCSFNHLNSLTFWWAPTTSP